MSTTLLVVNKEALVVHTAAVAVAEKEHTTVARPKIQLVVLGDLVQSELFGVLVAASHLPILRTMVQPQLQLLQRLQLQQLPHNHKLQLQVQYNILQLALILGLARQGFIKFMHCVLAAAADQLQVLDIMGLTKVAAVEQV
jgi:hypothetical protein